MAMQAISLIKWILLLKNFELLCAKRMEPFIVGGVEISIDMYPFVAFIMYDKFSSCGGVIITDRVILTAGHCVKSSEDYPRVKAKYLSVYVGSSRGLKGKRYEVCALKPHPKYLKKGIPSEWYDLGLLLLRKRLRFNSRVQKAILPPDERWKNMKYSMTVVGFGQNDEVRDARLKSTVMSFVSDQICNMSQSENYDMPLADHMFCMIGQKWTSDCHGDSGSAIVWRNYVVGTVSTGRTASCGSDIMPSMYQNLYYFKDWIYSTAKKLAAKKKCYLNSERRGNYKKKLKSKRYLDRLGC